MVLSTTKRTAAIDSIVNQNQGGGNKKAGFPYLVGRESWTSTHLHERGTSQRLTGARGLVMPMTTSVNQSRPLWARPAAGISRPYEFKMMG